MYTASLMLSIDADIGNLNSVADNLSTSKTVDPMQPLTARLAVILFVYLHS